MRSATPLLLAALSALGCATATTPTPSTPARAATTPEATPISPPGDLPLGQPVEHTLASGHRHDFALELAADQFVYAVVDQRGVDLAISVHDPSGEVLGRFDRSAAGPEPVSWFTERAGVHRISIEAVGEDGAEPGRFAITLARVEAAAAQPAGRVAQLMSHWERTDRPGAAIAVAVDGALAYSGGWGGADLEHGVRIEPTTVFQVASVSKQFTAFAIAMLAQQTALSLDDDVRAYVPEVPDLGAVITLRHLLNHTSGLRDQWALLSLAGVRMDEVITTADILALVRHQQALDFAPGTEFAYSNTGYTVLAQVVERVAGKPFRAWCAEHLFAPLGMQRTAFRDDHESLVRDRAYSYSLAPDGARYTIHALNHANAGATGLYTTVEDLIRWAINLDTGAVGGAAAIEAIHERARLQGGAEIDYAAGLYHGEYRGLAFVGHGGGDAGYRAMLLRVPAHRFAVAVASNDGDFDASGLAQQIAAIYLADHVTPRASAGQAGAADDAGPRVGAEILDAYVGAFRLDNGMEVTIRRDGEKLLIRPMGLPELVLVPESDTAFTIREFSAKLTFERDGAGPVARLTLHQGGGTFGGQRVEPHKPSSAELAGYAGVYFSPELETFYTVSVRDGALIATHRRNGEIALTPVEVDRFSGSKWYFERVAFAREGKAVARMLVSNGRMRDVRFERLDDATRAALFERRDSRNSRDSRVRRGNRGAAAP